MGLDVWFSDDVRRCLHSKAQAASRYSGEFRDGYLAALDDLAVEFGVVEPELVCQVRAIAQSMMEVER